MIYDMTRAIISLEPSDKGWLEKKAKEDGVPMTEVVRTAIRRLREDDEKTLDRLLDQTSGVWKHGDGLEYQRKIRGEWR